MKARMTLLVLAGLFLVGCAVDRTPLRIGLNDWPPCAVWAVAQKEGFLKDVPVEFIHYSNWSDNMESLSKGKLDLTHSTYLNSIFFGPKGEPSKIIISLDTIEGSDGLLLSNAVASPKDLAGKQIAVEVETDEHFLLYKALASFGVDSNSVKIVSATSKRAAELFKEGTVDACFTYDPYLAEAAASGLGRIVWTTKDAPGNMIDVLVVRQATLDKRRSDVARLVKAWFKALDFIKANSASAYPIMAASMNMKLEDFVPFYEAFQYYGIGKNREIFASAGFRAKLEEMSAFLLREKVIPGPVNPVQLYDSSFVEGLGSK